MNRTRAWMEVLAVAAAVGVVSAVLVTPSTAQKAFLERARKIWTIPKAINNCKLCHEFDKEKKESANKENLNVLGKALHDRPEFKPAADKGDEHKFTPEELDAVEKALRALEADDTDKDGVSNKDEITKGTHPAKADSK